MPIDKELKAEALQYDADALRVGIEKCKKSIKIFEDAIAKEKETIERFNMMIFIKEEHDKKNREE